MGKTILTPKQLGFLELAASEPQITKRFYLTGGTALSEFYLKHRLSEDIDLFCEEQEVEPRVVEAFLQKIAHKIGVTHIKRAQFLGLFSYTLVYRGGEKLKIDFNYYPFLRIERGMKYRNLDVNSIYDIAVDKLHTLFMKPRARDYVDLYFVMDRKFYPLEKLISNARIKFDWDIDKANLASQFLRVKDFADFPRMLVPFDRNKMEEFFLGLARSLEREIFK